MATNWTLANATKEILAGNKEATQDIGRRFPLTLAAIAKMGNNEGAIELINALPEHITARKIESILKDGVAETEVDTDDDDEVKTPDEVKEEKKERKPRKKKEEVKEETETNTEDDEYSGMSAMELYKLCKKRGLKVEPKQKHDVYAKALRDDDAKESEDDWEEEEEVKPAKKAEKKAAKKPAKKVEEVVEDEEDEDDDWDI